LHAWTVLRNPSCMGRILSGVLRLRAGATWGHWERQPLIGFTPVPDLADGRSVYTAPVEDRATLTQARSMLILLLAACQQTQTALEAAANALDTDLTNVLGLMIERTEGELEALQAKIAALPD